MNLDLLAQPHRRFNALTQEWVLVSPNRNQRPWLGQTERVQKDEVHAYDPGCYMCPGNIRATGERNPHYSETFVFDNDYPALVSSTTPSTLDRNGLIVAASEPGLCRVLCFSPRHDLTIATMAEMNLRAVVDMWATQFAELDARSSVNYVQIFENRGTMMGASNPHPHGQIWATRSIPTEPSKESNSQLEYRARTQTCLLCDYLVLELQERKRVVFESASFVVIVPFWAVWPFETLMLPKRHLESMSDLNSVERQSLAEALHEVTIRYDRLFDTFFPYSMGFHQRPSDGVAHPEWHMHAHFFPPLLRSSTIRKFMVGYEMLGMPQRDITPETAAERLRDC